MGNKYASSVVEHFNNIIDENPNPKTKDEFIEEEAKSAKHKTISKPSSTTNRNTKAMIVTGYIRHIIFVLLDDENNSVMTIIPFEIIKLCQQYYEANMIMFLIQSCFNNSSLNGLKCLNLNCRKVVELKITSMENPGALTTTHQHWFDKTVQTFYLPNIRIPKQAYSAFSDILAPISEPSIILKCNLNAWRNEHKSSFIVFDNRLLHNWNFNNGDHDGDKEINAFEMQLPVISHAVESQLRMFIYSKDHGLLALDSYRDLTLNRLRVAADDEKSEKDKWSWTQLDTTLIRKCIPRHTVSAICVIDSPSLQYGKTEKLCVWIPASVDMYTFCLWLFVQLL